jgi:hypothetical protein
VKAITRVLVGAAVVASSFAATSANAADNLIASRGVDEPREPSLSPPSNAAGAQSSNEAAAAKALDGTPFAAKANAAAMPALVAGRAVRRSIADRTFTDEDRAALGAMGFKAVHAGVVVLHKIPKRDAQQVERVKSLVHQLGGFMPANACDAITSEGPGRATCSGSTSGPIGKVSVRMPVQATFGGDARGGVHVAITNPRAMEVKPLFSWSSIVAPEHLKLAIDMYPVDDGWLVYTRIGVNMREHAESAKTITDTLEKIDAWLMKDLSRL